ncbi:MAG: PH domain-containing protein, partial [Thermoanaerobaculia bacterium]
EQLLRFLRVPPAPESPAGGNAVVFRAAPNFLRYKIALWGLGQVGAITGLVFGLLTLRAMETRLDGLVMTAAKMLELFGWLTLLVQIPLTYLITRLDFELRWYIVTDRSLRIREGITRVTEKTMTFVNIQNMAIRQGPLQRLLGIADLEVRTAGGGGSGSPENAKKHGEDLHVAFFRGVDRAPEIRDLIRERVRRYRDAGLGDPDDPAEEREEGSIAAAQEVLAEVKALRGILAK